MPFLFPLGKKTKKKSNDSNFKKWEFAHSVKINKQAPYEQEH